MIKFIQYPKNHGMSLPMVHWFKFNSWRLQIAIVQRYYNGTSIVKKGYCLNPKRWCFSAPLIIIGFSKDLADAWAEAFFGGKYSSFFSGMMVVNKS